jgi:anti-anti-sigma factor
MSHIKSLEFYKGVTIVRITGSVTFDNLASAQAEYKEKLRDKPAKNILFDLRDVSDTDTSGIAALIELFKHMKANQTGEKIGLINISQKMKDLLDVLKTAPLFNVYSTEEKAIKDLE